MDQEEAKQIKYIPVNQLVFDPKNPRLPSSVVNGEDEGEVINWMLNDATIIELMGAIGEKGFFPAEPLLVVENKKTNKFEVIEGNRRLTAVKLLLEPTLAEVKKNSVSQISSDAKHKPNKLPVFIYNTREEILDYLGFKHITGVKSWSALAKAKYLSQLKKLEPSDLSATRKYQNLAKAIGSRADYVRDLLVGLEVFEKIEQQDYFNIPGLNENSIEFGVYYTALGRSNIPNYLGVDRNADEPLTKLDLSRLENLTKWLSEKGPENRTRLGESRNLSKLNEIIAYPKALQAFESGRSLSEAILFTDEPSKSFQNFIQSSLTNLHEANGQFHLVLEPSLTDLETIKEIRALSRDLFNRVNDRLNEMDDDL